MPIKNIVFDVGNVLVKWDPSPAVALTFPTHENTHQLSQQMFKSQTWYDLNLGKISEKEAIQQYHQTFGFDIPQLTSLIENVKASLTPIPGSFEFLEQLHQRQFPLYALTDNTHENMIYLRSKYNFWNRFRGVVVSADIGFLKPAPQIYQHLLDVYHLNPEETLFLDDVLKNVEGAKAMNIHAIQFDNVKQCLSEMRKLGISL